MRQSLPRVPQDRIAVLIGAKGVTRRELETAAGCKSLQIDSTSGDIEVTWPEAGEYDPVKALKLPDVIKQSEEEWLLIERFNYYKTIGFLKWLTSKNTSEKGPVNSAESVQGLSVLRVKSGLSLIHI